MQIKKTECNVCKALHPDTLFPSEDGVCVYCKAEEAERLAPPQTKPTTEEEQKKLSQEAAAHRELALRALARKRMLPFVERFDPNYQAGWVHKDICQRLERFSEDVSNRKSPRLMLFMPPRHGYLMVRF